MYMNPMPSDFWALGWLDPSPSSSGPSADAQEVLHSASLAIQSAVAQEDRSAGARELGSWGAVFRHRAKIQVAREIWIEWDLSWKFMKKNVGVDGIFIWNHLVIVWINYHNPTGYCHWNDVY